MKTKFSRIFGVGLVLAVLVSTFVVASPASAGNVSWTKDSAPTTVSGVDILDLAVASNGTTGYAVSSENNTLYETADGGKTWTKNGFAGGQAQKVAVAPDVADGSFVAVIADSNELWVSTNGGTSFSQMTGFTPVPTLIRSVAISPAVGTSRSVAFAADNSVFVFTSGSGFGAGSVWTDVMSSGNVTVGPALAVKFSPSYLQDRTLVVISTDGTNTRMNLYNVATALWNADYSVYQVPDKGQAVFPSTAPVVATQAAIDMPSSYMAFDSTLRTAYLALGTGGLFRNTTNLSTNAVNSVAVNAAGDKLVAGALSTNTVYRIATPSAATVTVSGSSVSKSPGFTGNGMVSVEFFGASVGAATVGGNLGADESAFALSGDDGKSFNDVAFIDTVPTVTDFAINGDGSKYYLVSQSGTVVSLWRKTTAWERVFKVTSTPGYIVRPAADNFDVVYFAERSTKNIWFTNDAGQTVWQPRVSYQNIDDMAVESTSVIYVVSGASVSKAVDGGYLWDNPLKVTGAGAPVALPNGSFDAIYLVAKDNVVVSGNLGFAYTTDGGSTWTAITKTSGVTMAVADKLSTGGVITAVAAGDGKVYQYTTSNATGTFPTTSAATPVYTINGLVLNGGVVYAQSNDGGTTSSTLRSKITNTTWSTLTTTGTALVGLQGAAGGKLYSMATAGTSSNSIFSFTEVLAAAGPKMTLPVANFIDPINVETGNANDIVFQWTAVPNAPTTATYNLQIAFDSAFTQVVDDFNAGTKTLVIVGPSNSAASQMALQANTSYYARVRVNGTDTSTIDSPWSASTAFKIDLLQPLAIVAPMPGVNDVPVTPTFVWVPVPGATTYEIVVSDDPTFKIITFSRTTDKPEFASDEALAYSTVYYWRVRASAPASAVTPFVNGIFTTMAKPLPPTTNPPPVTVTNVTPTVTVNLPPPTEAIPAYFLWLIIGIGAILVIALIVLIVRTRRSA